MQKVQKFGLYLYMADKKLIKFLNDHREYFTFSDMESVLSIPASTITKALMGKRDLTTEQELKIYEYIRFMKTELDKLFNALET